MALAIVAIDPAATVERDLVDGGTVKQHIAVEPSCVDQRRAPVACTLAVVPLMLEPTPFITMPPDCRLTPTRPLPALLI